MSLRKLIFHNFWAKAGSLLLAVMIWHVVSTWLQGGRLERPHRAAAEEVTFYQHPITVMKSAHDERAFRVKPATVSITLRGSAEALRHLRSGDLTVFINLVDLGDTPALPKRVMVHLPPGVTAVRIEPFEVTVERLR